MSSNAFLKQSFASVLKDYALVTVGVISYALGWSVFLLPNNLVGGGVSGFASILMYATGIPMGTDMEYIDSQVPVAGASLPGGSVVAGYGQQVANTAYVLMPDLSGMKQQEAADTLAAKGLTASFVGEGKVVSQSAAAGTQIRVGETVIVELD